MEKYNLNIVGASGLVGQTFLKILEEENFPIARLNLYSGTASNGTVVMFKGQRYILQKTDELPDCDFTLLATDSDVSKKYAKTASLHSRYVIDNSSSFRLENNIPLVIPEINFSLPSTGNLIANPNCSTAICAIPLYLLNKYFGLKRVRICTYQSVSGSGKKGLAALDGIKNDAYKYDIRSTCIPQIGEFDECGYTAEENKLREELRKILSLPDLPVGATCVRVPVKNCHALSVSAVLKKDFDIKYIRSLFAAADGLTVLDEPENCIYPVSTIGTNSNEVYIGRIRKDQAEENSIIFYVLSDNLRRGAAYNAFKIIKTIIENQNHNK